MDKKIKQFFIFFLPTIIVVLVSVYSYQQNIAITADDSSDMVIAKIELPFKNINTNYLPVVFISNIRYLTLALESKRNFSLTPFLSEQKEKLININNNSPPNSIFG